MEQPALRTGGGNGSTDTLSDSTKQDISGPHSPRVSVLLCVFNEEDLVEAAVENIIQKQTIFAKGGHSQKGIERAELVIVNDGSNDRTAEILKTLKLKYSDQIRVLQKKHEGLCAALNFGLDNIKSPYIARADADDIMEPTRLELQLRFLQNNPDITAVGTAVNVEPLLAPDRDAKKCAGGAISSSNPNVKNEPRRHHQDGDKDDNEDTEGVSCSNDGSATVAKQSHRRHIAFPTHPLTIAWTMFFYCPLAHPSAMFSRRQLLRVSRPVYRIVSSSSSSSSSKFQDKRSDDKGGQEKVIDDDKDERKNGGHEAAAAAAADKVTSKEKVVGYEHCEDYALWHRLAIEGGHRLANLPSPPLVTLRKRPNSISSLHKKAQRASSIAIIHHSLKALLPPPQKEMDPSVSLARVASGFFNPQSLQTPTDLYACFFSIKQLEMVLLKWEEHRCRQHNHDSSTNLETTASEEKEGGGSQKTKTTTAISRPKTAARKDAENWIRSDATKRLGELAVFGMQKFPGHSRTNDMWKEWVSRDPSALLSGLLAMKQKS